MKILILIMALTATVVCGLIIKIEKIKQAERLRKEQELERLGKAIATIHQNILLEHSGAQEQVDKLLNELNIKIVK